jgi:hypothetical protein
MLISQTGRTVLLSVMDGPKHGRLHALDTATGSSRWVINLQFL